jgi:5-methyltetrahydropteroyltriglutamate--homocysteine methyltransferase
MIDDALRNVPSDRVRLHLCWGNYEGPHIHDIAIEKILPAVLRSRPGIISFEGANPRHAHEWEVWRRIKLPDDKIIMPGVIDSTTHFVEHPELVAQRIGNYADIVGRDRVIAAVDCGFETFVGDPNVDARVVYCKLASLAEGARIASRRLWPKAA